MSVSRMLLLFVVFATTACGGGSSADNAEEPAPASTAVAETSTTTTTSAPATTTTTTSAPTTTTAAPADAPEIATSPVVPGEEEDVDAIVAAYLVVFDSSTFFDDKAPYITDPSGLEGTVEKYAEAGDSVGGIALSADEVGIEGDNARVIYSFLFAGNPAYRDLEGEAVRTDAGWQITTEFFCEIMASARVGCSP